MQISSAAAHLSIASVARRSPNPPLNAIAGAITTLALRATSANRSKTREHLAVTPPHLNSDARKERSFDDRRLRVNERPAVDLWLV